MISLLKNLQVVAGMPPEKDELFRLELSVQYKRLSELKNAASEAEAEIRRLRGLEAASKGQQPAYIDTNDLITIIEDLLLTQAPVSKAFQKHKVNDKKCTGWGKRTVRYSVDKNELTSAMDRLLNNTSLQLMRQYSVLDIKNMNESGTYSAALNKMKKQLGIALNFQDKDNQLANKDKIIADKDCEIERLKKELLRNKSHDWQHEAIELKKSGVPITEIARLLNRGRTTISTYLNKSDVKLLILGSN